jgi:hypothetical protein
MTARANSWYATQCLEPWTRNYGRQLLRASDDAAREKVQEIVQVLFKYTSRFPPDDCLFSCNGTSLLLTLGMPQAQSDTMVQRQPPLVP